MMNDYEKGYIEGIIDCTDNKKIELSPDIITSLKDYRVKKLINHFEMIKKEYFKEIYLDGEHWHLVMIAEDGYTIRLNLNIGE